MDRSSPVCGPRNVPRKEEVAIVKDLIRPSETGWAAPGPGVQWEALSIPDFLREIRPETDSVPE